MKVPKSDQNMFLQAAQAAMSFDGGGADNDTLEAANVTYQSEIVPAKKSGLQGGNMLLNGGDSYGIHEHRDNTNIKEKRV